MDAKTIIDLFEIPADARVAIGGYDDVIFNHESGVYPTEEENTLATGNFRDQAAREIKDVSLPKKGRTFQYLKARGEYPNSACRECRKQFIFKECT